MGYFVLFLELSFPGGATPCNGLYGEGPPERGAFNIALSVYKWLGKFVVLVFYRVAKLDCNRKTHM